MHERGEKEGQEEVRKPVELKAAIEHRKITDAPWNSVAQLDGWLEPNEKYCQMDLYFTFLLDSGGTDEGERADVCLSVPRAYFRCLFDAMLEAVKSENT